MGRKTIYRSLGAVLIVVLVICYLGRSHFRSESLAPNELDLSAYKPYPESPPIPKSKDAGKDCTDNSQCVHACIAEQTYPQDATTDKQYVYHGRCASSHIGLCRMQIKDGKLFKNPNQICFD